MYSFFESIQIIKFPGANLWFISRVTLVSAIDHIGSAFVLIWNFTFFVTLEQIFSSQVQNAIHSKLYYMHTISQFTYIVPEEERKFILAKKKEKPFWISSFCSERNRWTQITSEISPVHWIDCALKKIGEEIFNSVLIVSVENYFPVWGFSGI